MRICKRGCVFFLLLLLGQFGLSAQIENLNSLLKTYDIKVSNPFHTQATEHGASAIYEMRDIKVTKMEDNLFISWRTVYKGYYDRILTLNYEILKINLKTVIFQTGEWNKSYNGWKHYGEKNILLIKDANGMDFISTKIENGESRSKQTLASFVKFNCGTESVANRILAEFLKLQEGYKEKDPWLLPQNREEDEVNGGFWDSSSGINRPAAPNPQHLKWSGTGFALNNNCIVTNYHVVENAKKIKVRGIRGNFSESYTAKVVATDIHNDLAIVKVTDDRFYSFGQIPYRVKISMSEVGVNVFVLGYPLTTTMGEEIKLTTGVVSAKTGFMGDVSVYQISAPVQPGNSGGPCFDENGNVIGIINAKHTGAENVGYAIKTSYLKNLAESAYSLNLLPTEDLLSGLTLSEKVKKAKSFVFIIECEN